MSAFGLDVALMKVEPINKALTAISTAAAPFINEYVLPHAKTFTSNPWYCFGIGPVLSVFFGCMISCVVLEWLSRQGWVQKYMIIYSRRQTREGELAKTQSKVDWWTQAKSTTMEVSGPINIVGCVLQRYFLEWAYGGLPKSPLPTLAAHLLDFALLMLICDLGLYWGHRIQHMNKYLWDNCHSVHHRLQTPSAFSLAYIESRDTLLQAALPLLVGQFIVRAHPVTHCLYLYFHLQNNALNHSGIHAWWLNLATLKWLPLRCDNRLHDAHHRFSGFGPHSKNFGEMVWLWDWLFGTLSQTGEIMSAHATTSVEREGTPQPTPVAAAKKKGTRSKK